MESCRAHSYHLCINNLGHILLGQKLSFNKPKQTQIIFNINSDQCIMKPKTCDRSIPNNNKYVEFKQFIHEDIFCSGGNYREPLKTS